MAVVILGVAADGFVFGGDNSWTQVGPFLPGGGVIALALDPSSTGTVYAATQAGVFKTVDGGARWASSSRGLPLAPIMVLQADANAPSTLYASPLRQGIFRSSDGGSTWEFAGDPLPAYSDIQSLAIDSARVIYAGVVYPHAGLLTGGVFKSIDHGNTWTNSSQGLESVFVSSLAVASSAPSMLYAATDTGVFRTVNGGSQWTRISTVQFSVVVVDPRNPNVVYGLSSLGVAKSTDGGATWAMKNSGLPENAWATALAVNPTSSSTLYLTTSISVFKSTDGGETWAIRTAGIETADLCPGAIALASNAPNALYLGNQCAGGVFRSDDAAASWKRTEDKFAPPAVAALIADSGSSAILAASDHGVFRVESGGATWTSLNAGLVDTNVYSLAQAPSDAATLYAGASSGKLYRSADRGLTWTQTGLVSEVTPRPLAVDPGSSATVYAAAADRLLRSKDEGQHWSELRKFGDGISALLFQVTTLYLGTSVGEVWTTEDGGETWRLLHALSPYTGVTAIVVDPRSPSTLYASWISSNIPPPLFSPNGGVFKSTDGGLSWQSVEEGIGLTSLVMSPRDSSVLYTAGLRGEAYVSTDAGVSWEPLAGLPDGWVTSLTVNPLAPSTLYAGMATNFEANGVFALGGDDRNVRLVSGTSRSPRVVTRPD